MAEFAGIASAGEIFGISKFISVPISSFFVWLLVLKGDYKMKSFLIGCSVYLSISYLVYYISSLGGSC